MQMDDKKIAEYRKTAQQAWYDGVKAQIAKNAKLNKGYDNKRHAALLAYVIVEVLGSEGLLDPSDGSDEKAKEVLRAALSGAEFPAGNASQARQKLESKDVALLVKSEALEDEYSV